MFKYNPNIYTANLPEKAVQKAIEHAKEEFPNESCGMIIDEGIYVPFENKSESPDKEFLIEDPVWYEFYVQDSVACLVHSHNNYSGASFVDQQQQQAMNVPWMVINLKNRSLMDCIVFGGEEVAPLLGRPFFFGAFDCLSLVRDYYKLEKDMDIPNPPHSWEFWETEAMVEDFLDNNKDFPFREVEFSSSGIFQTIEEGDIVFYNVHGTKNINHIGVVCSKEKEILHHFYSYLSGKFPANYCRKYIKKIIRRIV